MTTSSEWRMWLSGITFHLDVTVDSLLKMMDEENALFKDAFKKAEGSTAEELKTDHISFRREVRRAINQIKKGRASLPSLPLHVVLKDD